jgi:hypothetical protein
LLSPGCEIVPAATVPIDLIGRKPGDESGSLEIVVLGHVDSKSEKTAAGWHPAVPPPWPVARKKPRRVAERTPQPEQ